MKIRHTLYSAELTPFAPEGVDVHTWTRDTYAHALVAAYLAEWPAALVQIEAIHQTIGAGSGVQVIDDEGMSLDDEADRARELANRVLESLSQAAPTPPTLGLHQDPVVARTGALENTAPGEMGRAAETEGDDASVPASVEERGNGFPDAGEYVPGDDGALYRVVTAGSRIETQGAGRGNVCLGYRVVEVAWDDCPEGEEFPALAIL